MQLRQLLIILILTFLPFETAFAFIPNTDYIFEKLTKDREKILTYKIRQTRTIYGREFKDGSLKLSETVYLVSPWRYARKSKFDGKIQATIYDGSRALKVIGKKWMVPRSKAVIPFIYGFYLSRDKNDLTSFLASKGINSKSTNLSRMNELVAILFSSNDKERFKLFVDRDSFWPISYRYLKGESPVLGLEYIDIIYSNYNRVYGNIYFPMRSRRYEKDKLIEEVVVRDVAINEKISSGNFNISAIKRKYNKFEQGADSEYYDIDYPVQ